MSKKILLVEDNVTLSAMYADVLRDEGYEVITADEGILAEKMIKEDEWDLLLLDIMLPKLDGISILNDLKKSGEIGDRPVIIISNVNEPNLLVQSKTLGVKDFLVKSDVSLDLLLQKIATYLQEVPNEQY